MADSTSQSSALVPVSAVSSLKMEKCLFVKKEVELPEILTEDFGVFLEVVSAHTWQNVLSDAQRRHLLKFLPSFQENDVLEKQGTLRQLFTAQNFKFGSPLKQFHKKLREGMFSPDIAKFADMCRKAKRREYAYQQQVYYGNLLKEIVINRQRILEQVYKLPPHEPLQFTFERFIPEPRKPNRSLNQSVKKKYKRLIREINLECGLDDTSSEDEDSKPGSKGKRQLLKTLYHDPNSEVTVPAVLGTFENPRTAIVNGENASTNGQDAAQDPQKSQQMEKQESSEQQQQQQQQRQKRAASPIHLTEDDYKEMLNRHKLRRLREENHPELDTRGITLEDVVNRSQAGKKVSKGTKGQQVQKKKQLKAEKRKKLKQQQKEMDVAAHTALMKHGVSLAHLDPPAADRGLDGLREGAIEDYCIRPKLVPLEYNKFAHFFAVLRDFIAVEPEGRINTVKVEEKVREWQESPSALKNDWFTSCPNWLELVPSALKFLSGDVLGLMLENFVPYLDYKERAQQWKWIGQGRDTDCDLSPLCSHWLENKEHLTAETVREGAQSPPPPRVRTSYVVRPSTEEEKSLFMEQEHMRFDNPHRAFTYCLHGYEAVVGPVKGVYDKDSSMNKAREHSLLVNDRPAYVTILTLVRDAAARLPNGEGTRSDICELLKDSSFLAPGITDAQINTVVSGALDRLHYEKDPCVKYDVSRKLWIYLHRNRTEDEFEKIHQAQGAAAKAKKSLQKPKPSKVQKTKDPAAAGMVGIATSVTMATTPQQPSAVLSTCSNDSFINVETLSPVSSGQSPKGTPLSPRTPQMSPKIIQLASPKSVVTPLGQIHSQNPKSPSVVQFQTSVGQQGVKAGGLKLQIAGPGQQRVAQIVQSPPVRQVSASLVQGTRSGSAAGSTQPLISSGKPVAFNLIHSQGGTKIVESLVQGGQQMGGARTVVLTSKEALAQKLVTAQQVASPDQNRSQLVSASSSGLQQVTVGSDAPVPTGTKLVTATGGKPVVTRIVQQGGVAQQQVVSLSNLVVGTTPIQKQSGSFTPTTIKIQGGSVLQTATGKPASLIRAQSLEGRDSKPSTPTPATPGSPATIATPVSTPGTPTILTAVGGKPILQAGVRGGKPGTVMLTRTVTPPGGKPRSSIASGATIAQVLQSAALGGKPASFGGKPIIIGGKPAVLSGKPIHLGGKPIQVISKQGQLGYVQGQLAGTAINIVTQASSSATSAPTVRQVAPQSSPSLVSQILQSGTAVLQPSKGKPATVSRVVTATSGSVTVPQQARMVAPHQGGIVVTQLPSSAGGAVPAKAVPVSQAGLIGTQIIMQSQGGAARVVTPQQLLAGGVRPTIVATPGGKPQNIQLLKTVISQPGGKPGQTTFLLAQPGSQSATPILTGPESASQQPTVKTVTMTQGPGAPAKTKGAPVYARIITPPPGIRLAAVRPGQVSPGQASPVSIVQAVNRLPATEGQPQVVTMTTTAAAQAARQSAEEAAKHGQHN